MKDYSATTGAPIQDDAPITEPFAYLPLAAITPSPANPRKTFAPARMAELVDSIRASGVHQPILVRPLPGARVGETDRAVQYEIIAGERRYRASLEAGVPNIPAMIRALTDEQALEVMLVENVMRDDLAPLEEAEGYDHLMQHTGLSADEVAAKIGKSRSYVYAKLKLLDLCQEVRQALRDGSIDASRALLIARIPDGKLQLKALSVATAPQGGAADAPGVRAFGQWLQQNVMLRLEGAPFPITDAKLTSAGSCKDCPKRTGANPDLFSDVAGADVCTDPACYHLKEAAHHAHLVHQAQAKGMKVLAGADAKAVVTHQWDRDALDGYTRLDSQRHDATGAPTSLRNLLAGVDLIAQGIQPVLIEHPRSKELIEAVPTAETEALLITKGLLRQSQKAESVEREIAQLRHDMEARMTRDGRKAIWRALVAAIHADPTPHGPSVELQRAWLINQCDHLEEDDLVAAFNLPDVQGGDRIEDRARLAAQRASIEDVWRATTILMMAEDQPANWLLSGRNSRPTPMFDAVATMTGLDIAAISAEARAAVKAEVAEEIKALKAQIVQAKKPPTPNAPAAPAGEGAGGKKPKGKPERAAARAKVSAEEAQLGIAAAMQGMEGAASADAVAPPAEPGGESAGLRAGARVTILPSATGKKESRWIGKTGTVQRQVGPQAWDVCFTAKVARPITGKNVGEFQSFHVTEMEVEEA